MTAPSEMKAAVAALRLRSFTQAGAALGLTGSAVAKLMTRLEARLGVRLLHRTTRRLALTAEGEIFLARAERILADTADLEASLSARQETPQGPLRIACPNMFAIGSLIPALPDFQSRYPGIRLELEVSDARTDPLEGGVDVLIRRGAQPDSAMIIRKLRDNIRLCCAAPSYLARHGTPVSPRDLQGHECLFPAATPGVDLWPFPGPDAQGRLRVSGRTRIDNAVVMLAAVQAGLGIAMVTDDQARPLLQSGALVEVLAEHLIREAVPISLMMHPGRARSARVRVFADFCVERFGAGLSPRI